MSIDEKGVGDITRDDRSVINVNVIYIVNNIDTFALTWISWLNNPNILFWVMLL